VRSDERATSLAGEVTGLARHACADHQQHEHGPSRCVTEAGMGIAPVHTPRDGLAASVSTVGDRRGDQCVHAEIIGVCGA
jgi:hypothetical protein